MNDQVSDKLRLPLFLQRLALAAFIGVWTIDKFVNPSHASGIFSHFYGVPLAENLVWLPAAAQLLILIAFLLGLFKTISYLLMFLMHTFGTLTTTGTLFAFYGEDGNLLFWAAVPVVFAFWLQFVARDYDSIALEDLLKARKTADAS